MNAQFPLLSVSSLMVAITVAIAATVYVYVSGMIGGTKNTDTECGLYDRCYNK